MSENDFTLTVLYKGILQEFTGRLLLQGYTYKIILLLDDTETCFERDETGSFRVVAMRGQDEQKLEKDRQAVIAIVSRKAGRSTQLTGTHWLLVYYRLKKQSPKHDCFL